MVRFRITLSDSYTYSIELILGSLTEGLGSIGNALASLFSLALTEASGLLGRVEELQSSDERSRESERTELTLEASCWTLSVVEKADPPGPYCRSV